MRFGHSFVPVCIAGVMSVSATGSRQEAEFQWVNPLPESANARLRHGTFRSDSMGIDVGYVIYLPPGYSEQVNVQRRYPVVYHLHGGRVGSEIRSMRLLPSIDGSIQSSAVPPRIYVFTNGGKLSHYDYLDSLGETAFVKELVPHIDNNYRTLSTRSGRAIEGFSMGGRGTARIMFKHPDLFCSAIPMAGGHQHEKRVSENNGQENNGVVLDPRYNSWDLARDFAGKDSPPPSILVVVGTRDRNYTANLEWMDHLESLGIPFERRIVPDAPHSPLDVYEKVGDEIVAFHESCFAAVSR